MRTTLSVILIALALITQPAPKPSTYPITAVPLADVQITEGFWKTRLETHRTLTIPHILSQNELTGRIDNFLKAGDDDRRVPRPALQRHRRLQDRRSDFISPSLTPSSPICSAE